MMFEFPLHCLVLMSLRSFKNISVSILSEKKMEVGMITFAKLLTVKWFTDEWIWKLHFRTIFAYDELLRLKAGVEMLREKGARSYKCVSIFQEVWHLCEGTKSI